MLARLPQDLHGGAAWGTRTGKLLYALLVVARNDAWKATAAATALDLLQGAVGAERLTAAARCTVILCVGELCFDAGVRRTVRARHPLLIEALQQLRGCHQRVLQQTASKALFLLFQLEGGEGGDSTGVGGGSAATADGAVPASDAGTPTARGGDAGPGAAKGDGSTMRGPKPDGHIMISYSWQQQTLAIRLRDQLRQHGYKVGGMGV